MPSRFQRRLLDTLREEQESVSEEELADAIDEALHPVIEGLWGLGYFTTASCAGGHQGYGKEGYIVIDQILTPVEEKEVSRFLRRHGIKVLRITNRELDTWVAFKPLGGPHFTVSKPFIYRGP